MKKKKAKPKALKVTKKPVKDLGALDPSSRRVKGGVRYSGRPKAGGRI
jgi:hypothetical protein